MDYEKKYKEVFERAKQLLETSVAFDRFTIERIFPELKESWNEKIRKALIEFFESEDDNTTYSLVSKQDILDWLNKQGEKETMEISSEEFDNNIITRDDEILQAISIGLNDVAEDAGWSDFGGLPIEEIQTWLEKQVGQKSYWNEEDEDMCSKATAVINKLCAEGRAYVWPVNTLKKLFYWLKSLKTRR